MAKKKSKKNQIPLQVLKKRLVRLTSIVKRRERS